MSSSHWRGWLARLPWFSRRWSDSRIDEELQFHLDRLHDDAVARGLSPAEAARDARRRLGPLALIKDQYHDQRSLPMLDTLRQDIGYTWRMLRRAPGHAAVTVLTLTLGIAATTTIFSLVQGVLIRPLPYPDPDRLVRVFETNPQTPKFAVSPLNLLDYQAESNTFDALGGYTRSDLQLGEGGRPERLVALQVTPEYFTALGAMPRLGRNFESTELLDRSRVLIVSHDLWMRRFDADASVVGRTLRIDGEAWTIVGVMPEGFEHVGGDFRSPPQGRTVDAWWPLDVHPDRTRRYWHYVNVVGRVRPGVSLEDANRDLERVADALERRHPDSNAGWGVATTSLSDEIVGSSRLMITTLFGAVIAALLIACFNVSGLLLARAETRQAEMTVRMAIGANRARVVRQAVTENVVLAALGGLAGLATATAAVRVFLAAIPSDIPRVHAVTMDARVVAFGLAVSALSAIAFGVAPVISLTRGHRDLHTDARRSSTPGTQRIRWTLLTLQVALSFALLMSAGLLLRSLSSLLATDKGFDAGGTLTFTVAAPSASYRDGDEIAGFYDRLLARLRELPAVQDVGAATALPWTGWDENSGFSIVGRDDGAGPSPNARFNAATPGYFEAVGIPLLRGRVFRDADGAAAPPVVVINESLARTYFGDEDPLGHELDAWSRVSRIVGVVGDVHDRPEDADAVPAFFFPHAQRPFNQMAFAIRTDVPPLSLVPTVRSVVREIDAELPIADVRPLADIEAGAFAQRRFLLGIVFVFAGGAVGLTAIGIFGALAYTVQQRRRELAIRMAIGARAARVVREVVGDGLRATGAGLVLGAALAGIAGRVIQKLLYGTSPMDPMTGATAALLMAGVAVAASVVPAVRATATDPAEALRAE